MTTPDPQTPPDRRHDHRRLGCAHRAHDALTPDLRAWFADNPARAADYSLTRR